MVSWRRKQQNKIQLNNDGDSIYLPPSTELLENHTYSITIEGNSAGRYPDGTANWITMCQPTPETTNNDGTCNPTTTTITTSTTSTSTTETTSTTTTIKTFHCGDTITENTTMSNDLIDCEQGLTIGADNITLDCQGHAIDFAEYLVGDWINSSYVGIYVQNKSNILIKN